MSSPRYDDAKIHLVVLGQDHEITARVRSGPCKPVDVMPLARRVTDTVTAAAVRAAEAEGRTVSCKIGCAACCRHLVPIAPLEALAIARLVKALPGNKREAVRRRFGQAVRRMEELGLLDAQQLPGRTQLTANPTRTKTGWEVASGRYFEASIACPLLENERCTVYEDRPLACRQHLVTSPPERCKQLDGDIEATARPVWMSEILSEMSASLGDVDPMAMPLPLALEWSEACAVELEGDADGEELVRELMERVTVAGS